MSKLVSMANRLARRGCTAERLVATILPHPTPCEVIRLYMSVWRSDLVRKVDCFYTSARTPRISAFRGPGSANSHRMIAHTAHQAFFRSPTVHASACETVQHSMSHITHAFTYVITCRHVTEAPVEPVLGSSFGGLASTFTAQLGLKFVEKKRICDCHRNVCFDVCSCTRAAPLDARIQLDFGSLGLSALSIPYVSHCRSQT
jgi:hypothetical protein